MLLKVKNLGQLRQAEFEMGDLTILCGKNNTGKTYATYALYGFLSFWEEAFVPQIPKGKIDELLSEGTTVIELSDCIDNACRTVKQACDEYTSFLPRFFASSEKMFSDSAFEINIQRDELSLLSHFTKIYGSAKKDQFSIKKNEDGKLEAVLLVDREQTWSFQKEVLTRSVGNAIKEIIFSSVFPHPFIASAERTGAAIFRKELDFARNRLLEQMSSERNVDPYILLDKVYADYALPVRRNVDFTRNLEDVSRQESFIAKRHHGLLGDFSRIIGGQYKVVRNELYYVPDANKRLRLTMDESSSAVRSLLDIGFYLHHVAKPNDLLIVDEPELNLHPENQRKIARLFARLVNIGVKVFITTHSDYIIKEINTLIMLNQPSKTAARVRVREKYCQEELIRADRIRVYMAEEQLILLEGNKKRTSAMTLVRADIDPVLGIEAESFDKTIDDMNRIQESLFFTEEDD